jgi:hypothetical protein
MGTHNRQYKRRHEKAKKYHYLVSLRRHQGYMHKYLSPFGNVHWEEPT